MEAWDVFVTDNGETVVDMLNGVVAFTQTIHMQSLVSFMLLVGLLIMSLRYVTSGTFSGGVKWLVVVSFVFFGLFVPKKAVMVTDYSKPIAANIVEDVPLGLAMILSFSTTLGDKLVRAYETAFGTVEGHPQAVSFQYSSGGMLAGERVLSAIVNADTVDARLAYNFDQFLSYCVFPDAVKDKDFEAITGSGDLVALFGANTSSSLTPYKPAGAGASFQPCNVVAPTIVADIENDRTLLIERMAQELHPDKDKAGATAAFTAELGFVADRYIGLSMTGPEMISQLMSINMINRSLTSQANSGGEAAIMDFVNARAAVQSRLTMSSMGGLMQNALPVLHSILLIVLVALFPIIVVLSFLPGDGSSTLRNYFEFYLNLQIWPLLFAIFSRIVEGQTIERAKAVAKAAKDPANPQIDMTTIDPLANVPSETSAMALMMIALIPGIAVMVRKGSSAVSGQLESALRPIQAATEAAASEGVTGNFSMGNTSLQNHSTRTRRSDQVMTSPNIDTGIFTMRTDNSGQYKIDRNGRTIVNAAPAISNMATSGAMSEMAMESYNQRRASAESQRRTATNEYNKSLTASKTSLMAGALAMREGHSSTDIFGYEISARQSDALQQELSNVESYMENNGLASTDQVREYLNKELAGTAGISLGGGFGPVKANVGGSATIRKGSERQSSESSNVNFGEVFSLNGNYKETAGFQKAFSDLQSNRDQLMQDQSSSLSSSIAANLAEAEGYRKSIANANNQIESLEGAYNRTESGQMTFSRSLTPDAVKYIMSNPNFTKSEARAIALNEGTNTYAMSIQREAYERAVDDYLQDHTGFSKASPDAFVLAGQNMHGGIGSAANIRTMHGAWSQDAIDFRAENKVAANAEFMSRDEMARASEKDIYTPADKMGRENQTKIGTSLKQGGSINQVASDYTPEARLKDAERYVKDIQKVHDSQPYIEKHGFHKGSESLYTYKVQTKPSQEELDAVEKPRSGSIQDAREDGHGAAEAENYIPVVRGRGGQSAGVGLVDAPIAHIDDGPNAPANDVGDQEKTTPLEKPGSHNQSPAYAGQTRQRSPLDDIKKVLNQVDSPAPGLGAADFAIASAAVSQRIGEILPETIGRDTEFGGLVYRTSDGIFATKAREGEIDPATGERSFNPNNSVQDLPPGAIIIGDYHTHGGSSSKANYDGFSQKDIAAINSDRGIEGIDASGTPHFAGGWLGGTQGQLSFYPADTLPDNASDQAIENASIDLPGVAGNTFEMVDKANGIISNGLTGSARKNSDIANQLAETLAFADDPKAMIAEMQNRGIMDEAFNMLENTTNTAASGQLMRTLGENSSMLESSVQDQIRQLGAAEQFNYNLAKHGVEFGSSGFDRSNYQNLGLRTGEKNHKQRTGDAGPFTGQAATGEVAETLGFIGKAGAFFNQSNEEYKDDRRNPVSYSDQQIGSAWFFGLTDAQKQEQASLFLEQPIVTNFPESYGDHIPTRGAVIKAFSEKERLDPNFVTGIMMAEAWDNSKVEEQFENTLADMGRPASIGIAQGNTNTITRGRPMNDDYGVPAGTIWPGGNERLYAGDLDNDTSGAAIMLQSDEYAIAFAAGYLRNVADHGATMDYSNHQTVFSEAQSSPPYGFNMSIDRQMLSGHGSQWDEAHQRLIASEYTSTAFDTDGFVNDNGTSPFVTGWAHLVLPGAEAAKSTGYFNKP